VRALAVLDAAALALDLEPDPTKTSHNQSMRRLRRDRTRAIDIRANLGLVSWSFSCVAKIIFPIASIINLLVN
jgi:hypothetical protein